MHYGRTDHQPFNGLRADPACCRAAVGMKVDLAVVMVGGVQRFIGESRSTADVSGASDLLQTLLRAGAERVQDLLRGSSPPFGLIFPAGWAAGVPVSNKVVFLAPPGAGGDVAAAAASTVRDRWRTMVTETLRQPDPSATPGVPDVAWAAVTGSTQEYGALWAAVQSELAGRRRARVFAPYEQSNTELCAQSPGLPAVPAPAGARRHDRDEKLSAAGWVKRQAGASAPSTVSIASASFRSRLLRAAEIDAELRRRLVGPVARLASAVQRLDAPRDRWALPSPVAGLDALRAELGPWLHPARWAADALRRELPAVDPALAAEGRAAALEVCGLARAAGIRPPSPYLAVLTQDLDRLGRALAGMSLATQRTASAQLSELGMRQRELVAAEHPTAHLVYTGGDDLLAFCPADGALALAAALRGQVRDACATGPLATAAPDGGPITASTGLVFVHMSNPLQDAVDGARAAIRRAKKATDGSGRSRDAVCVVVRRRGGERAATVQPWSPGAAAATDLLALAVPGPGGQELSAGLASLLERDAEELESLSDDRPLICAEIRRLVLRQGGTQEIASALVTLGYGERGVRGSTFRPVGAALVARFLAQEAR